MYIIMIDKYNCKPYGFSDKTSKLMIKKVNSSEVAIRTQSVVNTACTLPTKSPDVVFHTAMAQGVGTIACTCKNDCSYYYRWKFKIISKYYILWWYCCERKKEKNNQTRSPSFSPWQVLTAYQCIGIFDKWLFQWKAGDDLSITIHVNSTIQLWDKAWTVWHTCEVRYLSSMVAYLCLLLE